MTLNAKARAELRMKFGGFCAYCGIILPEKGWHADHVEPVARELKFARDKNNRTVMVPTGKLYRPENDRLENLYPACAPCNIDKGGIGLEDWRHSLREHVNVLRRGSATFRHAERFQRVAVIEAPLVFWFEKYAESAGSSLSGKDRT